MMKITDEHIRKDRKGHEPDAYANHHRLWDDLASENYPTGLTDEELNFRLGQLQYWILQRGLGTQEIDQMHKWYDRGHKELGYRSSSKEARKSRQVAILSLIVAIIATALAIFL